MGILPAPALHAHIGIFRLILRFGLFRRGILGHPQRLLVCAHNHIVKLIPDFLAWEIGDVPPAAVTGICVMGSVTLGP